MKANDLLKLAPKYHQWVDQLLKEHASAAKPITELGFARLPTFFNAQTVATARCVVVDDIPKFPWAELELPVPKGMDRDNFAGDAFRTTYFVARRVAKDESLHFHEMVHVVQWHILGADLFPLIYALEAFSKSYDTNYLEVMARNLQRQFESTPHPILTEPMVAAHLGLFLPQLLDKSVKGQI